MDYSTFNTKSFIIGKNSTYPLLKFPLIQQLREKYDIDDDMLQNVAVTFSMVDAETGVYRIANKAAHFNINDDITKNPADEKYTLVYKFTESQTRKSGNYLGEFKLDFIEDGVSCGKLTLPVNKIMIRITDSITKTTVK